MPFLLEPVGSPRVACKAELLDLPGGICRADQWPSAAETGLDRKPDASYRRRPCWEAAARTAVYAGRSVIEGVASSVRPEEAPPARKLLQEKDCVSPFPEP
ncbi:hypothetical protein GCM10010282_32440 [Streptomyces roseolus]|nr:hypothetical protein GCM10010282_32440 [Streptomyces roseolus]